MDYLFRLAKKLARKLARKLAKNWSYKQVSLPIVAAVLVVIFVGLHVVLWWLWDVEVVAIAITTVLLLAGLAFLRSFKLALVVMAVAIGGTLQDVYFVDFGLWAYMGGAQDIPRYIPIVWGIIAMLLVVLYKVIWVVLHKLNWSVAHRPPRFWQSLVATLATLGLALWALATLADTPIILIVAFLAISANYLLFMRSVPLAIVSLVTLVVGALGELVGVSQGAWNYAVGGVGGVPIYIFFGWDIIGAVVVGTYITLGQWRKKHLRH